MLPYVVPFALYLLLTQIPAAYPGAYPLLYTLVLLIVGLATVVLLRGRQLLRPHAHILPGVLVGVVGIFVWIGLGQLHWERHLLVYLPSWLQTAARPAFDPFTSLSHPVALWGFLTVRLLGLVIAVPVVEELFWRGFLIRWLTTPAWKDQPSGQFSVSAFVWVTLLFMLAHPEWLAAAVYCMLLNGLLYWTRDLWNCVAAHAVTNLLLGIYILTTGTWELW